MIALQILGIVAGFTLIENRIPVLGWCLVIVSVASIVHFS